MDLKTTLILLAVSVTVGAYAGWRGAQPPNLLKGPRMVPWRFVMVLAAALVMLLLIHLASMGGAPRSDWV